MNERRHHLLVIEPEYLSPDDPDYFDFDPLEDPTFSVYCPGVTSPCSYWYECREGEHGDPDDHDYDYTVFHGVEHNWIDGMWMTETGQCIVQAELHDSDDRWYAVDEVKRIPGVYPVDHDWDESLYLTVIDADVPNPEIALS